MTISEYIIKILTCKESSCILRYSLTKESEMISINTITTAIGWISAGSWSVMILQINFFEDTDDKLVKVAFISIGIWLFLRFIVLNLI